MVSCVSHALLLPPPLSKPQDSSVISKEAVLLPRMLWAASCMLLHPGLQHESLDYRATFTLSLLPQKVFSKPVLRSQRRGNNIHRRQTSPLKTNPALPYGTWVQKRKRFNLVASRIQSFTLNDLPIW